MSAKPDEAPTLCTIVARNYLAHARALTESFRIQHPDGRVIVLLVDRVNGDVDPAAEPFELIEAEALGIPAFGDMAFRYSVLELSTAVKPFFLEYLMERRGIDRLIFLDPDIYLYAPLAPVFDALETAEVALTPHLLRPLESDGVPSDLDILRSGVYNLGFIAVRRGPNVRRLLRWWQRKLEKACVRAMEQGLFVDQRWADFIPAFVGEVAILRHPGLNVAYWNLPNRRPVWSGDRWQVDGWPLVFYHFSGLQLDDLDAISTHQSRFTLADRPELRPLFEGYRARLLANDYERVRSLPYAYGHFDNGVPIPEAARRLWQSLGGAESRWSDPLGTTAADSFFQFLNESVAPSDSGGQLTQLALAYYNLRADLQAAFPDVLGSDRLGYLAWFVTEKDCRQALDPVFIDPVEESLAPAPDIPEIRTPLSARLYFAVRNPMVRLGMERLVRRVLGSRRVDAIYEWMVRPIP